MLPPNATTGFLDRCARTDLTLLQKRWPAFKVCGIAGALTAFLFALILASRLGLSPLLMTATLSVMALASLALVMASKILTGEERLILYHNLICVITVASLVLLLLRQPILPYLDVVVLANGAFVACVRVGCLMVGCCHGRPFRWGVVYGEAHVAVGLPRRFLGVRLFPSQVLESLWTFGVVSAGCVLISGRHASGAVFGWFIVWYCAARFYFEFARWYRRDDYSCGLTEAQWTSLALVSAIVGMEFYGVLPFRHWHAGILSCMAATAIALVARERVRRTGKPRLDHPDHLTEIAEALELSRFDTVVVSPAQKSAAANVRLGCTSLGIQISSGKLTGADGDIYHYAFSRREEVLTEAAARALSKLILQMKRPPGSGHLLRGDSGVFHLLIRPPSLGAGGESQVL